MKTPEQEPNSGTSIWDIHGNDIQLYWYHPPIVPYSKYYQWCEETLEEGTWYHAQGYYYFFNESDRAMFILKST